MLKYNADPTDVRNPEGTVPLHKSSGELIDLKIDLNDVFGVCWIRVLIRSKGWRATADVNPPTNPATK